MLNRRHIRIKVLQAFYAFNQSNNNDLEKGLNEFIHSMNKTFDLYIYYLQLQRNYSAWGRWLGANKIVMLPVHTIISVWMSRLKMIPRCLKSSRDPYLKTMEVDFVGGLQSNLAHLKLTRPCPTMQFTTYFSNY